MADGEIHLKGNIMSSFEAYDGYITRYDGDVMYIGVKFRIFLYDAGNTMNFDISVPVDRPVSKIVLAGGTAGEQKELYPVLEDEPEPKPEQEEQTPEPSLPSSTAQPKKTEK